MCVGFNMALPNAAYNGTSTTNGYIPYNTETAPPATIYMQDGTTSIVTQTSTPSAIIYVVTE
jgi:hypothetical protein